MSKTWEDYYNDPEIVNEPSAMREIHAVRLMLHDKREELTTAEYTAFIKKQSEEFLQQKPYGGASNGH